MIETNPNKVMIEKLIDEIYKWKTIVRECQSVFDLCEDFEATRKKESEARQNEELFVKNLVNFLNDFIDYPIRGKIIKRRDKVKYVDDDSIGFIIKIPFIDKQEFYCVRAVFRKNRMIHEIFRHRWKDEYYID